MKRKNFRSLNGKPLYKYIIENALQADCFDEIYVDTDSEEIKNFCKNLNMNIIHREERMTRDDVNGNDLLVHQIRVLGEKVSSEDLIFQLFATAPFLKPQSIRESVEELRSNLDQYDSIFTATEESGWHWFKGQPVNFRPVVLPRSQDSEHVVKESTGLYGIKKSALERYHCRIGAKPIVKLINPTEAVDLDTDLDFSFAELMIQQGLGVR